jgi:hypothetical protein
VVKLISGPDFEKSSIFVFDIDGTQLTIPVPEESLNKTMSSDTSIINLNNDEIYDVQEPGCMLVKRILKTQFEYVDTINELPLDMTGVMIQLLKVDDLRPVPKQNLLSFEESKKVFFQLIDSAKTKIKKYNLSERYYVAPECINDIDELYSNNIQWQNALSGYAEVLPPVHTFITPITTNHLLMIELSPGSYNFGTDEQSAQMRAEAEADVFDFIRSIRIEFSPEVQAEIDEVRGAVAAL